MNARPRRLLCWSCGVEQLFQAHSSVSCPRQTNPIDFRELLRLRDLSSEMVLPIYTSNRLEFIRTIPMPGGLSD